VSCELDKSTSESDVEGPQENQEESSNVQLNREDSILRRNEITQEIDRYINEPLLPRSCDPMNWWSDNVRKYKILKDDVVKYLRAPACSVASERLFSVGRRVYTANRNKLLPPNAERLLRIIKNNTLVMGIKPVNSLVAEEFYN